MEEQKVEIAEELKKVAEVSLEALVEAAYPSMKAALIEKLKEIIPGDQFDVLVDLVVPPTMEVVKAELLKQIEKISDKV